MHPPTSTPTRRGSKALAYTLLLVVVVPFLVCYYVLGMRFFMVPTDSMVPTLVPPDYLITFPNKHYEHGDIVVLTDPRDPSLYLVKRIVALENDRIVISGGVVTLNEGYVSEPYLAEPIRYEMPLYRVPTGEAFVLGDNRNASADSHNWGANAQKSHPEAVPLTSIIGEVYYVYLPVERARRIHPYPLRSVPIP